MRSIVVAYHSIGKLVYVFCFSFFLSLAPLFYAPLAVALGANVELEESAKSGNAKAQYRLSQNYRYGHEGFEKSDRKHVDWLHKSAANGFDEAQVSLALWYRYYKSPPDFEKTVFWLKKAAEQGNSEGQYLLGKRYKIGEGVGKDLSMAVKWFAKSSDQGDPHGKKNLAMMYLDGLGTPQDIVTGERLFKKAAVKIGGARTSFELGLIYDQGKTIGQNYCEAERWYKKAAAKKRYDGASEAREALPKVRAKIAKNGLVAHCLFKEYVAISNPDVIQMVHKALKGYQVGLNDLGEEAFLKAIKADPLFLYGNNYWHDIHSNRLPLFLAGKILLAVKSEKQGQFGFWFDYAHTANLSGQPALALLAIKELEQLDLKLTDKKLKKEVLNISALLKANALVQMGRDKDAYAAILEKWEPGIEDDAAVNYINHWAKPLLKDKKKLSLLTGIKVPQLTGKYASPKPQLFPDLNGTMVKPVARAGAKLITNKKKKITGEKRKTKGTVLD